MIEEVKHNQENTSVKPATPSGRRALITKNIIHASPRYKIRLKGALARHGTCSVHLPEKNITR